MGNISATSHEFRDKILENGGLESILKVLKTSIDQKIRKSCIWVVTNFCRGKPTLPFERVRPAISLLIQLLKEETDPDSLTDTLWMLTYYPGKYIQILIND